MFENYKAAKKDFGAIEEGIGTVWRPELDFIFKRKNLLKNIVVVSYDSFFIYLWTKIFVPSLSRLPCNLSGYYAYKIPHKIRLKDEWQRGWRACSQPKPIDKLLPKGFKTSQFKTPIISGGLLAPFIELQKKNNVDNLYVTRESFLATIVHEFGHAYWIQHRLWWYSNKEDNISFLQTARQLCEEKKVKKTIYFPMDPGLSELYAILAEYTTSEIFWKSHKHNLDIFIKKRLKKLIKKERTRDLDREDSVLAPGRNPHDFAFVFGKIIASNSPKTWPKVLTNNLVSAV